jgi:phenylalanyl-tRNA synthetase beta chain
LGRLSGAPKERLPEILVSLGIHVESETGSTLRLEYDPNRPDYSSDYGIARAIRGKLGIELGLPKHAMKPSGWTVTVDASVKRVRPFIVALLAKNIRLDDEDVRQLIGMQEDLHEGIGRRRKKLAIGLHDAGHLESAIRYTTVDSKFKFVPLGASKEMTVEEVIEKTEQGKKYGGLVSLSKRYPMLMDSRGTVLSMPPIINGSATAVTSSTKTLFVDITGHDLTATENALAIVSETLWDLGGSVQSVRISDGDKARITPDTRPKKCAISVHDVSTLLGVNLPVSKIKDSLLRTRFDAAVKGKKIIASIPRYRVDILHPVDVVEEVGYGFGYENLVPDTDFPYSKGRPSTESGLIDSMRRLVLGLGFQEVVTFTLKSVNTQYVNVGRSDADALKVESSKTKLYEYMRDLLVPGILEVLGNNVHEQYPQRLFEIGSCLRRDHNAETGVNEELKIGGAIAADVTPFSDMKSVVDAIIEKTCGFEATYTGASIPFLLDGRAASIYLQGKEIGYLGEVAPHVLNLFKIKMPVSVFEFSISKLF